MEKGPHFHHSPMAHPPWSSVLRMCSLVLLLTGALLTSAYSSNGSEVPASYQPLVDRLSKDGFNSEFLCGLFTDPRAEAIPAMMTISLTSGEARDFYNQFLTPESIRLAKKFKHENSKLLNQAEKQFHVEKEVIVAILLVESRFGENIGRWRIVPTLASMAIIDSPENLQSNYLTLRENDPEVSYDTIEMLSRKRGNWAYSELKCFLTIVQSERIDPLEVRGSYAGALGMAQFLPSSYLAFADKKSSLDEWLLSKEGAVFSIGNYLKVHGWRKNLSPERKKRVLWYYNHSKPYVETILQIARRIK